MLPPLEIEIKADPDDAEVGFRRVEKSLDALDAATNKYNADLAKLNKAVKDGFVSSARHAALLEEIEQEYKQAASAAAAYSKATVVATRNAKKLSTVTRGGSGRIQNASYQIADFATQVGAGTSASIALGQQLPQLLGGFGALGAVMGAVVAIGVPLGASLIGTGEKAKTLEDQLDDLAEAINAVNSAQDRFTVSARDLREEFGAQAEAAREVLAVQREIANIEALMALNATIGNVAQSFGELEGSVSRYGFEVDKIEETTRDLAGRFDLTVVQAINLAEALREVGRADGPYAQVAALRAAREQIELAAGGLSNMDDETRAVYQSMLDAELAAARLAQLDISSNITTAADEAARLKDELWKAAAVKYARESGRYSGRGSDPRMFDTEGRLGGGFVPSQEIIDQANAILNPRSSGGRRGGGRSAGGRGSAVNPLVGDIEQLRKALATETELIEATYAEQLAILQSAQEQRMITQDEYQDLSLRSREQYLEAMRGIEQGYHGDTLSQTGAFFGDMANAFAQGNEKMLQISKAFSSGEALINAWRAYSQTIADPSLPFAAKFAAGASVLAAGMNAVSAIKGISASGGGRTTSGGGGGGGGGGSTAAATAGGGDGPLQVRLESIDPNALFTGGSIGTLLERLQDEAGDRGIQFIGGGIA